MLCVKEDEKSLVVGEFVEDNKLGRFGWFCIILAVVVAIEMLAIFSVDEDIAFLVVFLGLAAACLYIGAWLIGVAKRSKKYELVVTDKHVYFSLIPSQVSVLPFDKISSVSLITENFITRGGFSIATSSSTIRALGCTNCKQVADTISQLLSNRQDAVQKVEVVADTSGRKVEEKPSKEEVPNAYEELKTMKSLLDEGLITQEEYDQKKKQILKL